MGNRKMISALKVAPKARLKGIQPEMAPAFSVVPAVFALFGYDCWLTCAVEPRSKGLHPKGLALDFDSSSNIPIETGESIAAEVKGYLGMDFDCPWHGPKFHLHVEFDPKER